MKLTWTVMFVLCIPSIGNGYEVDTHDHITRNAIMRSIVAEPDMLRALGLEFSIDDRRLTFQNSRNEYRTILELTADGSRYEDGFGCTDTRPTNHFFDPENDRPLTYLFRTWGLRSPDWALEDQQGAEGQEYSLKDALDRFHEAMSLPEKEQRERSFGLLFQTLGHVMHHVQDMAQPEHVRNDAHLVTPCRQWVPDGVEFPWEDRSLYEYHTNQEEVLRGLPVSGYELPQPSVISVARKLWVDQGRGMAEFTNSNFVSTDTNFRGSIGNIRTAPDYPSPVGALGERWRIEDPRLLGPNQWLRGWMQFIRSTVVDTNTGEQTVNQRAATHSIFASDLKRYNVDISCRPPWLISPLPLPCKFERVSDFALNRFNFDAAHEFLMPRAVAYSAGLVDHFFRGRISLVDVESKGNELIVRLRNTSANKTNFGVGHFLAFYDATDGHRKKLELTSGEYVGGGGVVHNGEHILRGVVPVDAGSASDSRYVVVFRGEIGHEPGIAALVFDRTKSGFIIRPSRVPADGISGDRLLTKEAGQWVLSPDTRALDAGNVDWKGRYVDGVPTRVLSWIGPDARYYPRQPGQGMYGVNIYHAGELYAVAPCDVLGAAIQTAQDGHEWLVVVCPEGNGDIVYRRPASKDASATDWQLVGIVPAQPDAKEADRPWFFNGTGTEAQTMRRAGDKQELVRLRLTVNGMNLSHEYLGNTEVTRTRTKNWEYTNCEFGPEYAPTVTEQTDDTSMGETVIAVDYVDSREVLAVYEVKGVATGTLYGYKGSGGLIQDAIGTQDLQHLLRIGERSWPLFTQRRKISVHFESNGISSASNSGLYHTMQVQFMDLRHGLVIYDNYTAESSSEHVHDVSGVITHSGNDINATVVDYAGGQHDAYRSRKDYNGSFVVEHIPRDWGIPLTTCYRSENGSETDSTTYSQSLYGPTIDGSYAVTPEGDMFASFGYRDVEQSVHIYSYFTGGDPVAISGTGDKDTAFHPIRLR